MRAVNIVFRIFLSIIFLDFFLKLTQLGRLEPHQCPPRFSLIPPNDLEFVLKTVLYSCTFFIRFLSPDSIHIPESQNDRPNQPAQFITFIIFPHLHVQLKSLSVMVAPKKLLIRAINARIDLHAMRFSIVYR